MAINRVTVLSEGKFAANPVGFILSDVSFFRMFFAVREVPVSVVDFFAAMRLNLCGFATCIDFRSRIA